EVRVAVDRQLVIDVDDERGSLLFRERPIKLGHLCCDLREIDPPKPRSAHAGIDLDQAQQCIEDADHAVDVRHCLLNTLDQAVAGGSDPGQLFKPGTQLGERRPQIVGDRIGGVANALDQIFDLLEHQIDHLSELVEFVARVSCRQALYQVTRYDSGGGAVDDFDPTQHGAPDQETADNSNDDGPQRGPTQPLDDQGADFGSVLDIAPHEQPISLRQRGFLDLHPA